MLLIGIGVAAAALINYFNELSDAEEKNKKAVEDSNKALEGQLALMDDLNRRRANDLKIAEANAKLVGKSEEEISEIRRASLIKQRDDAIKAVNEINKAQDLAVSKFKGTEEEKTAMLKKYSDMRNKQISDRNAAETSLELEKIALQQAAADKAKEKTKKDEEDAKNRRKERIKNEKDSLRELNEARRVAEEAFYTDESKKRRVKYENDLERLKEAKAKELEQDNLTAQAKENIRLAYIKKENAITYEFNNSTAAYQKTKDEEAIAQKKATEEKLAQEAEKRYQRETGVINDYFDYKQIELDNADLSEKEYAKQSEDLELKRLDRLLKNAEKNGEDTLELEKQIAAKKKAIKDNEINEEKARRNQIFNMSVAAASDLTNALQSLSQVRMNNELAAAQGNAEKQEEIKKTYFEKDKNFQYAKTSIAGIQAGVQAFAQGMEIGGPLLAAIFLAASLATTGIQLQAISESQYISSAGSSSSANSGSQRAVTGSQYAEGGLLMGASHNSGGIQTGLGELEGGEFVMNRRSTANFLPLLNTLNAMGNTPGPMPTGQQSGSPVIKTYVVASDVTSAQEANARISRLAKL